eukprot:CAMPEP_0174362364 /NCGR_PEP_ID=MMETSP0811_2-20130205/64008_1 /TAXON_ID=73025 ORGANISM="Eutreptiella gymnastica-like, Strain CCMP1594" /NCGR_SAMPLE_ID=MMETSP0811_2 /ASSEMBLY_ACC=CAM_ASM_000667 /LENGTH=124 /DNA_ID=CAMNT_0015499977 /DNA_START=162 /DNA_END=534 /DNA_ORIENTATION=-
MSHVNPPSPTATCSKSYVGETFNGTFRMKLEQWSERCVVRHRGTALFVWYADMEIMVKNPEVAEDLVEDTYFPLDIVGVPPTWDGHQVTVPQALLVCASGHASPSLGAGMKEDPMPHSEVNHGR